MEPGDDGKPGRVHYLPHHTVIRQDKQTTWVRVVYDASSSSSGPSLNNCLHTGPKFNQKILEILLRFRSYPVAVVADIEKAFLMISVEPNDRDVLRFLWVKDMTSDQPEIVTFRFSRVVGHDNPIFDFQEGATVADELHSTKRNVVSIIGRFYDPLGYLSPTTIPFKVYMQELFNSKLG